ncbi:MULTISPECIES: beta-N-acetylhexosaminidase [unclassified Crossiella]|uniref:beta-N-acetylhexosaminidase n=1 Tax=unclassified Crossiella TaxID=2620835 RepID=UPI001FFF6EA9|nr:MULTISPECIES: beta-N-acetylhexosaminidase [unclassified Crossiella]MCK2237920.1 beta-N-acetylhexosaminidase [Crossiella sp. S99.2]MCK2255206.1 beta-N-acetylhexosaminidase [Crossiella sp. S99.1]
MSVTPSFDVLLPRPHEATRAPGEFELRPGAAIRADPALAAAANWLRHNLGAATGFPLDSSEVDGPEIRFGLDERLGAEEYTLDITEKAADVHAGALPGARHAAQTLRQLFGPAAFRRSSVHNGAWLLPNGHLRDRPRFGWRGCLLDVARHFLPKDGVLRFLDLLAAHKFSVLHLHLTDDQGWRMEIERYPRLTEVGGWRERSGVGPWQRGNYDARPHGGFYTKDDLREIVGYAAGLGITVVPEIDVPGHTQAAIAAYPALGNLDQPIGVWTRWGINDNVLNVRDETVQFFRNVLDEVVEVFPAEVIGIGGDEVPLVQWRRSPEAQRRIAELGLADEPGLHGWFLRQLAEHLAGHGRKAFGWDEITEVGEVPTGLVVASWRGEQAGATAAKAGHDVVMCPEQKVYLDHRQSDHPEEPIPVGFVRTVTDVYGYEPVPAGLDPDAAAHVLGAQAQLWTEHLDSPRRLDYAAFPRLAAFAEVVWSPEARDEPGFLRRLTEHHLPRLDALGVEYRPLDGPRPWQRRPDVQGWPR